MNANFVNVWVLNLDLKRHRDAKGIDNISPLEQAIISGWNPKSPVDCLLISNDLEVLLSLPLNDFLRETRPFFNKRARTYRDAFKQALDAKL